MLCQLSFLPDGLKNSSYMELSSDIINAVQQIRETEQACRTHQQRVSKRTHQAYFLRPIT
jgi:hypothetical protein